MQLKNKLGKKKALALLGASFYSYIAAKVMLSIIENQLLIGHFFIIFFCVFMIWGHLKKNKTTAKISAALSVCVCFFMIFYLIPNYETEDNGIGSRALNFSISLAVALLAIYNYKICSNDEVR